MPVRAGEVDPLGVGEDVDGDGDGLDEPGDGDGLEDGVGLADRDGRADVCVGVGVVAGADVGAGVVAGVEVTGDTDPAGAGAGRTT